MNGGKPEVSGQRSEVGSQRRAGSEQLGSLAVGVSSLTLNRLRGSTKCNRLSVGTKRLRSAYNKSALNGRNKSVAYLPMGTFHIGCRVENHVRRDRSVTIPKMLVDTGSEYTWIPSSKLESIGVANEKKDMRFVMANGQLITRNVGFAVLRVGKAFTIDEVVFAEPGDLILLGDRTLEGLNLMVDSFRKKLVASGPLPAA